MKKYTMLWVIIAVITSIMWLVDTSNNWWLELLMLVADLIAVVLIFVCQVIDKIGGYKVSQDYQSKRNK
jgi:membrane protein YdbS with pleckstrin-like domain